MALIRPYGPDWGFCAHNYGSAPETAALGTSMTATANNTDGTPVTILSALSRDVEYLKLHVFCSDITASINPDISITVLIDPAGGTSWANFIPNLLGGRVAGVAALRAPGGGYDFPIWIPAGASVGAMARTAHSSNLTVRMIAMAYGGNANPASWWCGQRVLDIGTNPAASTGTTVTAGISPSFGSWTSLGSTLAADAGAFQMGFAGEGDTDWLNSDVFVELGIGSNRIGAPVFVNHTASESSWWVQAGLNFKRIAAGTQLQARAMGSADAVPLKMAAYVVC